MKRRIVDALVITAAIALSIPISPAKAQLTGGFNPAGSLPGLGLPDLGSGSDLEGLLGNSGGLFGGDPSAGGLFGGINGGNLGGGLLNGVGGSSGGRSSSGGD